MAFVVGPRQVGKTTLARQLLRERGSSDLYRNWEDLAWRRAVTRDRYGFRSTVFHAGSATSKD